MTHKKILLLLLSLSTLGLGALAIFFWRQAENLSQVSPPPAGPKQRMQHSNLRSSYAHGW